jgi:hypothetical protein
MKYYFRFLAITLAALGATACGTSQNRNESVEAEEIALYESVWQRKFSNAVEITALYDSIKQTIAEDEKGVHTLNQCHFVWNSGEYMFACRGKNDDIYELPQHAT